MRIFISASELAIITGHNTYKDISELYIKYWKKYFTEDFKKIQSLVLKKSKKIKLPETPSQIVSRIAKENNIDKKDLNTLYTASKEKNTQSMNKKKQDALNSMLKQIPKDQHEKLTKSVNSVAFTDFGTRNEVNGVKLFEESTNYKVEICNKYFSEDIFIIDEDGNGALENQNIWSIGGKVDGIFINEKNNKVILEIKNRVRKLFKCLRDYEKVQCFAYMFALNIKCVQLVECYKSKSGMEISSIEINWDEDFWNNQILEKVSLFVDDFYSFLNDESRKIKIIS